MDTIETDLIIFLSGFAIIFGIGISGIYFGRSFIGGVNLFITISPDIFLTRSDSSSVELFSKQ